jgi:GT2 family glycosyltransferase
MNDVPLVSVLVVNYNGRSVLADCLNSLASQSYPRHAREVIVVDNASTDDSVPWLREHYPWVRLFALPKNTGFAEGNNIAYRRAHGEWIALLNSDASVESDWLRKAIALGQSDAAIGGVVGQLVFRDRPHVVNTTGLRLLPDGRGADRDFERLAQDVNRTSGEVFGGCGAAVVLRRSMLDRIGLFDSRLFMYYEDLDLAWRAARSGWKFVYSPDLRGQHVFAASVGAASPMQTRYVERNRFLVNCRHAPLIVAIGTGIGLTARCGRAIVRWLADRNNTTSRHVLAHGQAVISALVAVPGLIVDRMNATRRLGSVAQLYRRWSRSS